MYEDNVDRCMLCNGHVVELEEGVYRCTECNYINHRSK